MKKLFVVFLITIVLVDLLPAQTNTPADSSSVAKKKSSKKDSKKNQNQVSVPAKKDTDASKEISNKYIEVDFLNPILPNTDVIRPKQKVEIVLLNVNPNVYDVNFSDSLITTPKQQPALFTDVFKLPELATLPAVAPAASDVVAGHALLAKSPLAHAKSHEKTYDDELSQLLREYAGIESNVKQILSYALLIPELNDRLDDCSSTLDELKKNTTDYLVAQINNLDADQVPYGITTTITSQLSPVKDKLGTLIENADKLKDKYNTLLESDLHLNLAQYKDLQKQFKEKITVLDKLHANAITLKEKLSEFETAKVGEQLVKLYNKIANSRVTIHHVVNNGYGNDELLSTVLITKKKEVACKEAMTSFPVNEIVVGGVRIDFSTGLVFNFGHKKFFDQKYSLDSVYRSDESIADSVRIVQNKNNNVLLPSLGIFLHVYSRWQSHTNIGGMIGASIGTDQRLYYHVGGCLLIGKSDRFIIGIGMSSAKATTLDGKYSEGQVIKRSYAPAEIPTEQTTRVGWFLSFSWNLNLVK